MKKILLILAAILLTSCQGLLWTGYSRSTEDSTMDVTIVIPDPMWEAYLEWNMFIQGLHDKEEHAYCMHE